MTSTIVHERETNYHRVGKKMHHNASDPVTNNLLMVYSGNIKRRLLYESLQHGGVFHHVFIIRQNDCNNCVLGKKVVKLLRNKLLCGVFCQRLNQIFFAIMFMYKNIFICSFNTERTYLQH